MLMYQKILIRRLELYVISSLFLFVHPSFFRLGLFRICFVKLAILITTFLGLGYFFFKYCFYLYTISTILIRSQVESTFVCCWLYQVYHQFKKVRKKKKYRRQIARLAFEMIILFSSNCAISASIKTQLCKTERRANEENGTQLALAISLVGLEISFVYICFTLL